MIPTSFLVELKAFVEPLMATLTRQNILSAVSDIDHVCYRVADLDRYGYWRQQLDTVATLLSDALVNGRPIATYKLHTAIKISDSYKLDVIELPSPKPGSPYREGFEHIEAVTRMSLEEFMARFPSLGFQTHNLRAKINRDISVKFPEGLVKFHECSLEEVIAQEKAEEALGLQAHKT